MADNALQPAVVDVPLGSLNQTPPDHGGVTGRLTQLYDAVITHYDAGGQKRNLIDPRQGFTSFSNALHNSETGASEAGTWASPSFLFALGDQLLSICSNVPRVYNGSDWTHYGTRRVVTQKLSQSVLHTTNNTIAAPDHAWISGVTCSVWTEQTFDAAGSITTTSTWVSFRADDGAWIRVPTMLHSAVGASNDFALAKVVQDGLRFWVFYNVEAGGHRIRLNMFGQNGVLQGFTDILRNWNASPGYWDVYGSVLTGVVLAQPAANGTGSDVHVEVKKISWNGSSFVITTGNLSTAHCQGPVAWLTSDLLGTSVYLATVGPGSDGVGWRPWAYEIDTTMAQTHEYDFGLFLFDIPDSITGWAEESGVGGQRNVYLSHSQLTLSQVDGPTFDPAMRSTTVRKCTFGGVASVVRVNQSTIQQSRAFAINGEYHVYSYYQSGSGQSLPSAPETPTIADGDFFIGAPQQPLAITGGGTNGAPFAVHVGEIVRGSPALTAKPITGADTVQTFTADGSPGLIGIPIGTPVLKWTFANATPSTNQEGFILKVNSSSITSANFQWDIYGSPSGGIYYTPVVNRVGGTVVTGTFAATGTVDVVPVIRYLMPGLSTDIPPDVRDLFVPNGTITITGASNPSNNGTFTLIERDSLLTGLDVKLGITPAGGSLWALLTTQADDFAFSGTATIAASQPYVWFFSGELFTDADLQSFLAISDNPVVANNTDQLDVISNPSQTSLEVDHAEAATTIAQVFAVPPPLPTVTLSLKDTSQAYTLFLSTFTFDYRYQHALVSIAGAHHPSVNGVFKISAIVDSHTVRVVTTNGSSGNRSETFGDWGLSHPTIVIQRSTNVQSQTQPAWFVTPLSGSQPQVGCFETGLAFADWRFDGESTASVISAPGISKQDRYRFALSSTSNPFGTIRQVVLPFRASSFTQVSIAKVGATPIDIANAAVASTVGLKIFRSQGTGEGTGDAGKLLVPGLLASEFTNSGFAESNFNLGPEAPFVVSEETDSTTNFALTPGQTYTYQLIVTTTLENGDVVQSKPSPPIQVTMTGTNNVATIGGRLLTPVDPLNPPFQPTNTYGLTNHANTTYAISRSVVVNGVPSTQLHLITNPGAPNAMYSGTPPGSGFTFPDSFTWNYRDSNPDAGIQATEVIYAGTLGQGIAPHFPAPPFSHATTWANRRWVVGYDGAVWMSAEIVEGEDTWFFPGFRYPFPEEDPAVCVVGFENFLFMFCAKSIWRIGITELPNATLTSGAMPPPVRLPFAMGCSGFALAMSDVVAFSSSVNDGKQVWAITRNLANIYLSERITDSLVNPVSGMAVDGSQRLLVLAGDQKIRVYDPVSQEWYIWKMPSAPALITSYQKHPTYQDSGLVLQQQDSAFVDSRAGGPDVPVAIDLTLSSLTFAVVRAVKRLREAQIIGVNNSGPCNINASIAYPYGLGEPATVFGPTLVPNAGDLLLAINPAVEDAGEFEIRIFGSYEGIDTPGRCFSLEMLSCEVGLDSRQGLKKLPDGFRIVGR